MTISDLGILEWGIIFAVAIGIGTILMATSPEASTRVEAPVTSVVSYIPDTMEDLHDEPEEVAVLCVTSAQTRLNAFTGEMFSETVLVCN